MSRTVYISLITAAWLGAAGCAPQDPEGEDPAPDDGADDSFLGDGKADSVFGVSDGSPEALCVLRLASELSQADLSQKAKVGTLAARYIAEYRLGPDKVAGTADDQRFETLAELDAVKYVGATAFSRLLAYARQMGCPAPGMSCAAPAWRIQVASSGSSVRGNTDWADKTTALAIGADGTVHVTYTAMRPYQGQLDYAVLYTRRPPGGAWSSEQILVRRGTESAMTITPKGEILVAATGAGAGTQLLRGDSAGVFVREPLPIAPNLGRHPSLVTGADGRVHMGVGSSPFSTGYAGSPYYLVRSAAGAWGYVDLKDSLGNNVPGEYVDVAADAAGGAHIVFSRDEQTAPAHVLRYGYLAPGAAAFARSTWSNERAWNPQVVATAAGTPLVRSFQGLGSMALAPDGALHMTSYTRDDGRLLHQTDAATEVVDQGDGTVGRGAGLGSALVITRDGRLHVSYHRLDRGEVRYAVFGCP